MCEIKTFPLFYVFWITTFYFFHKIFSLLVWNLSFFGLSALLFKKYFSVLTGFYTFFAKNTMFPSSAILQKANKWFYLLNPSTDSILKQNYSCMVPTLYRNNSSVGRTVIRKQQSWESVKITGEILKLASSTTWKHKKKCTCQQTTAE